MTFLEKLKPRSKKPVLITTREALIAAIITVIIIVIFALLYTLVTTRSLTSVKDYAYWIPFGKTFVTGILIGFAYEYSGINSRMAETSMRYATGSVLDKYASRNTALVASETLKKYVELLELDKSSSDEFSESKLIRNSSSESLNRNSNTLMAMIDATTKLEAIREQLKKSPEMTSEDIALKVDPKSRYVNADSIELLRNICPEDPDNNLLRLKGSQRLIESLGKKPELIEFFLLNGFKSFLPNADGSIKVGDIVIVSKNVATALSAL